MKKGAGAYCCHMVAALVSMSTISVVREHETKVGREKGKKERSEVRELEGL